MQVPNVETVLVGVDGSDESMRAVEYAVAIANRYDATLVALYVIDGADYHAISTGEVDPGHLSEAARTFLADAHEIAERHNVPLRTANAYGYSTHRKLVHPGSVVLDATEEFAADIVVLPREPLGGREPREGTLAKTAEYALLYASQPILAV